MVGPTAERETPPPLSASRRHGGRFALLALATLIAVRFPLPWLAVAIALVVAADVEGVRTARAVIREDRPRSLFVGSVCGVALISVIGLGALATVVLYPITYQRQECLRGANTAVASQACKSQYERRVSRLQSGVFGH